MIILLLIPILDNLRRLVRRGMGIVVAFPFQLCEIEDAQAMRYMVLRGLVFVCVEWVEAADG